MGGFGQIALAHHLPQRRDIGLALLHRRCGQAKGGAFCDVGSFLPAAQRGQIMRRDTGDGALRIGIAGAERHAVAFQQQHAIAQNIIGRQCLAQTIEHGAEILADDQRLCLMRFQRHLTEQIGERIGDISAVGRRAPFRHIEQPSEPERVIDAQATGVAEVGGEQFGEIGIAGASHRQRVHRWQSPDLSFRRERIGRCAHGDAMHHPVAQRPGLGPIRCTANGEVADDADVQPACGGGQRGVGQILQIAVKQNALSVCGGKGCAILAAGGGQRARPLRPRHADAGFGNRLEQREIRQRLPALGAEAGEILGMHLIEEALPQPRHLRRPDADIFDLIAPAQRFRGRGSLWHVEIDRIEEAAVRRLIG